MPMEKHLYPSNWDSIALQVKEAAGWTCQDCGRHCRKIGETIHEFVSRIEEAGTIESLMVSDALEHPQRWTLTVAHLNHRPEDCRPENLRALCSGCHLRYDGKDMALKKRLKRERNGQLTLAL